MFMNMIMVEAEGRGTSDITVEIAVLLIQTLDKL